MDYHFETERAAFSILNAFEVRFELHDSLLVAQNMHIFFYMQNKELKIKRKDIAYCPGLCALIMLMPSPYVTITTMPSCVRKILLRNNITMKLAILLQACTILVIFSLLSSQIRRHTHTSLGSGCYQRRCRGLMVHSYKTTFQQQPWLIMYSIIKIHTKFVINRQLRIL